MRNSAAAFLMVASLSFAACGGDSTGPSDNGGNPSMSTAEAMTVTASLFNEVAIALSEADFSGSKIDGSGLMMPTFTFSGDCSQGGTISGSGTYTETSYDFTYTPVNCKVAGNGTSSYTINGDPNIKMTWTVPASSSSNMSYTMNGGFKWNGGSCKINYTATLSQTTGHGTVAGTMCGNSVNSTF